MTTKKVLTTPVSDADIEQLKIGDIFYLTGYLITSRDMVHFRHIEEGMDLPVDLKGKAIFHAGPIMVPDDKNRSGFKVVSIGPTTSVRMDAMTPALLAHGLRGMIGKGLRSQEVIDACKKHGAVYFVAVGGAAAVIAQSMQSETMIAYEDLGPEAIRRYEVKDFPAIVCIDAEGNDFYKVGIAKYSKE